MKAPVETAKMRDGLATVKQLKEIKLRLVACGGAGFPWGVSTALGTKQQAMIKRTIYVPHGATEVQFVFAGAYAGSAEADGAFPIPMRCTIAVVPAPYDPAKNYAIGDHCAYANPRSVALSPYWTATAATQGVAPLPSTAVWSTTARPTPTKITTNGTWNSSIPTVALPDGTSVAQGLIVTDAIPFFVPDGGAFISVEAWVNQASGATGAYFLIDRHGAPAIAGDYINIGASVADTSVAGYGYVGNADAPMGGPVMVRGKTISPCPSVVIIGTSLLDGVIPTGAGAATIVAGGSNWQVGEIAALVPAANTTAGAVLAGSIPRYMIRTVSSGVVTGMDCIDTGAFAIAGLNTGQVFLSGTQGFVSLNGSGAGLTATVAAATKGWDYGNKYLCQGYAERFLSENGIPFVNLSADGDRLSYWQTRAQTRLQAAYLSGARTVIIEDAINDLAAGDTASALLARLVWLIGVCRGLGFTNIIVCTPTTWTTSTTAAGGSTLADQIITAWEPQRRAYIDGLRAGLPSGATALWDTASVVEYQNSGKCNPIGGQAASDSVHFGLSATVLLTNSGNTIRSAIVS